MKVNIDDITIGADPELFVRGPGPGRPFISAEGLIPGTKDNPHPIEGGAVQVDGMAVEYNINPCKTEDEFVELNNKVLTGLSKMIPNYTLVNKSYVTFSDSIWMNVSDKTKELGCDPDMNAYTGMMNPTPNADGVKFRTAAGHIHVGWTNGMSADDYGHAEACKILAKELDYYLGVPSLFLDSSADSSKRRKLYGKAGAYRIKPYGMEYRVLSNFWVGNEELMRWVFSNTKLAFANLLGGKYLQGKSFSCSDMINTSGPLDVDEIPFICNEFEIPLPKFS